MKELVTQASFLPHTCLRVPIMSLTWISGPGTKERVRGSTLFHSSHLPQLLWAPLPKCSWPFEIHVAVNLRWGPCSQSSSRSMLFIIVQLLSCVRLFVTLWTAARQDSLAYTVSWSLFSFTSIDEFGPLMSWWCYLTILSSATLFSFCLQSFPVSHLIIRAMPPNPPKKPY